MSPRLERSDAQRRTDPARFRRTEELRRNDEAQRTKPEKKAGGVMARALEAPAKKPTADSAAFGRTRAANDPAAGFRRLQLQDAITGGLGKLPKDPLKDPSLRTSRPAGEAFTEIPASAYEATVKKVNEGGDVAQLDTIDNFRQTLPPEQQADYDRQLAALREDDRIVFENLDGARTGPAERDIALRGLLAQQYGNPAGLEATIAHASEGDGKMHVRFYPGAVPIKPYYPGAEDDATALGLATPDGGVALDASALGGLMQKGDNPFVHEFAHLAQDVGPEGHDGRFPADFPHPEALDEAWKKPEFQEYLIDRFFGGNTPEETPVHLGAETWPTLQNLYRQSPEELKKQSPELYQMMNDYSGFDPLTGEKKPPVLLNGTGSVDQAVPVIRENFDAFRGDDRFVQREDLERVLHDPSTTQEMRAAAAYLLSSPTARNVLDVGAGRHGVDGKISREDLTGAARTIEDIGGTTRGGEVRNEDEARAVLERYKGWADTAAGRRGRDGNVSDDDLRALIADPGAPAELRAAARILLDS